MNVRNMIGKKSGRLLPLIDIGTKKKCRQWFCRCDCGGAIVTSATFLRLGYVRSCGCLKKEAIDKLHHINKKISDDDVAAVYASFGSDELIASRVGISASHVKAIKERRTRKDVSVNGLAGCNSYRKLTEKDVVEIRKSEKTHRSLAELYGVAFQTISKIKRRERRGDVK